MTAVASRRRSAITGTVALLLALGVALLAVAVGVAAVTMLANARDTRQVEQTLQVEATIYRLAAANEQIETGRRGFLINGNREFQGVVSRAEGDFAREQRRLGRLLADNPGQLAKLRAIEKLAAERSGLITDTILAPSIERRLRVIENFDADRGVQIMRTIRALTAEMSAVEADLLSLRNDRQFDSLVQLYVGAGAALVLLILVLGTVIVVVLRTNRALGDTHAELLRLNEGLEDAVAARTAELRRANQEIQRFAYIVSHDLRSPLVNVMGFTAEIEVARQAIHGFFARVAERFPEADDAAARQAIEEDLPESLGFIRASSEKMDRLINSILQLSRQGRRPLSPERLELGPLAEGVVATLHQRAQEAGATITVETLPLVESDRLAVEQILANLVENAIKYLSPARAGAIAISGGAASGRVHVDVTDNGRGIDPKDHERVFELFRRSGAQDQPGEGIGLAHARALAYRLGGTLELDSQLDRGARFRLSLPAQFVAAEAVHP